jgi:APA family basic amino acid/polyamine antiporter
MTSIGTLFAFLLVCLGILIMRRTRPDIERPFRTPLVPFIPVAGILVNLALMLGLNPLTWKLFFGWMALGLVIYFSYSRSRSLLQISLAGGGK